MSQPIHPDQLLKHMDWLRSLALSLVHDEDLAEDLVQETLLTAVKKPPRESKALASWLKTVLTRFAIRTNQRKKKQFQRELELAQITANKGSSENLIERVEVQRKLVDHVLALEEPLKTTVLLKFFENFSSQQIADELKIDVSTVRWRIRTALKKLRKKLDQQDSSWKAAFIPLIGFEPSLQSTTSTMGLGSTLGSLTTSLIIMKAKTISVALLISLLAIFFIYKAVIPENDHLTQNPPPENNTSSTPQTSNQILSQDQNSDSTEIQTQSEPPTAIQVAPTERPQRGIISGYVLDKDTQEAISGAELRFRTIELSAVTDEEGFFKLEGLKMKDYFLIASAEGFAESHTRVNVDKYGTFRKDFLLEPATRALITVVDTKGLKLASVEVTTAQPAGDYDHSGPYTQTTDTLGTVEFLNINKSSPQQIHARKKGYKETWWKDYKKIPGQDGLTGVIVLKESPERVRVIAGKVSDPEGKPISKAEVQWIHSWGQSKGLVRTQTDKNGRYELKFESEKEHHTISAFKKGWAPQIQHRKKTGILGASATINFTLEAAQQLEGRVVDEEGEAIAGVRLIAMPELGTLRNPNLHPGNSSQTLSDEKGEFQLDNLPGPTVAIRLVGPNKYAWAHNVKEHIKVGAEVELVLERWANITGLVIDRETQEPLSNFRIQIEGGGKGYLDYARMNPGESFDSTMGKFVLKKLDRDSYDLTIHSEGYISKKIKNIQASTMGQEPITVELSQGQAVEGLIVDAMTGFTIPKAELIFGVWNHGDLTWNSWNLDNLQNQQKKKSETDGTFEFLEDDHGVLFVRAKGYSRLCIPKEERHLYLTPDGLLRIPLKAEAVLDGSYTVQQKGVPEGFLIPILHRAQGKGKNSHIYFPNLERNPQGQFQDHGFPEGTYWIDHYREAPDKSYPGFVIRYQTQLKSGNNRVELGKELGSFSLKGTLILNSEASPQKNDRIDIRVEPQFDWPYKRFAVRVEAKHAGRFWLEGLKAGTYKLLFRNRSGDLLLEKEVDLQSSIDDQFNLADD